MAISWTARSRPQTPCRRIGLLATKERTHREECVLDSTIDQEGSAWAPTADRPLREHRLLPRQGLCDVGRAERSRQGAGEIMTVAFYGAGMLGSAMIRAMLRRGLTVNVWNRTPERARALEEYGARAVSDPAQAAQDAERIHLCLSDDASVDATIDAALEGIAKEMPDHRPHDRSAATCGRTSATARRRRIYVCARARLHGAADGARSDRSNVSLG